MGEFLNIAKTILFQERRPLRVNQIIELAREKDYLHFSGGITPHQTLKAKISTDIKTKKENSEFKRVAKGVFALRNFEEKEYDAVPHIKRISKKENVLVVRSSAIGNLGYFNGVKVRGIEKYLRVILNNKSTFYLPRLQAEKDTTHKQIVSYILVEKNNQLLRFIRGVYTNAHSMLRGSFCIGFGGHVQDYDLNLFEYQYRDNGYMNSVKRELLEELKISESTITNKNLKIIGILNDDSSEVGKSHIAIIHKLNLNNVRLNETKKLKGEKSINQLTFVPKSDLGSDFEKYEYWSKLCIKSFYKKYINLSCKIHRIKNYSISKHPKVIIIVGSIGSGKTEAARILEKYFGYKFISSGQVLQELMNVLPIYKLGRSKFQDIALKFILKAGGFDLLASKLLEQIDNVGAKYVIDGIRNIRTYEILKSHLGTECTLIFVESTPDNCFKFYKKREGENIEISEFYKYINHPVEQDIKFILGKSNLVVYNHGTLTSFKNQIKNFFKKELAKDE